VKLYEEANISAPRHPGWETLFYDMGPELSQNFSGNKYCWRSLGKTYSVKIKACVVDRNCTPECKSINANLANLHSLQEWSNKTQTRRNK